jgi:NAD+ synthase (glutamine-hydrolysing)
LLEACTAFRKVSAEQVMTWYLEGALAENLDIKPALISRWGIEQPTLFIEDLEWFFEGIRKSVFKRIQSPPIILTSPSAYGFDIRESQLPKWQSENYLALKKQVLALDNYGGAQG